MSKREPELPREAETGGRAPLLSVRDLYVEYKSGDTAVKAVNGVSFDLEERETIGLVGETGAGKTTTALSIMRLLPERTGRITGGDILLNGQSLLEKSPNEMRMVRGELISMIFQDPMSSLNPTKNVGDQVLEALKIHNHDNKSRQELDARVDELLTMVGIHAGRKREFPHQFSGGMKQRIVIAIALACEPQIIIADEPTTALDVTIQAQILALMEELKQRLGTSMVMITHDLGIVAETCDKVCIVYAGKVVEQGTVEDLFEGERHHPYTVGLFHSIPDIDDDASTRLCPIPGLVPNPTDLPSGCAFHPRCAHCMEICKREEPGDVYQKDGHTIRCHLYGEKE